MAKHTSGPWQIDPDFPCDVDALNGALQVASSWDANARRIIRSGFKAPGEDEAIANARLISAAPDLLDAAKGLRQHLSLFCGPDDAIANEIFSIADAVIAKAEGRS